MLTESFVASILKTNAGRPGDKDLGIHLHDFQPIPCLKASFKKSSTPANCLAVNASHIFAAQEGRALVHVYSRERGNQEAIVPYKERIHSVALAGEFDGAGILLIGTEGGGVILWELCTGRQVSTSQSHLQPTTCLAVDPTSNFFLSGSPDAQVHVWSLPNLLSFSRTSSNDPYNPAVRSPLRTLSNHRGAITALVTGHSTNKTNIAVSGSQDNTCIVWDYLSGETLQTFVLPTTPICLVLDPADRAVFAGYEDGSVQLVDFYKNPTTISTVQNSASHSEPFYPPLTDRWDLPAQSASTALCLEVSYDGTTLLSGHQNGKIHAWDVGRGKHKNQLCDLSFPVTNIQMLPPDGFPKAPKAGLRILNVTKPQYESSLNDEVGKGRANGMLPTKYAFKAQFASHLSRSDFLAPAQSASDFHAALTHPSFPLDVLEEGIAELAGWDSQKPYPKSTSISADTPHDGSPDQNHGKSQLEVENSELQTQLLHLEQSRKRTLVDLQMLVNEKKARMEQDERKAKKKRKRRLERAEAAEKMRKLHMGEIVGENLGESVEPEEEMDEEDDEDELSSSTDEMASSD